MTDFEKLSDFDYDKLCHKDIETLNKLKKTFWSWTDRQDTCSFAYSLFGCCVYSLHDCLFCWCSCWLEGVLGLFSANACYSFTSCDLHSYRSVILKQGQRQNACVYENRRGFRL